MLTKEEVKEKIQSENSKYNLNRKEGYEDKAHLVPQFYWGNIDKASIVILGKNPSYSLNDEMDNMYLRKYLEQNLSFYNRNEETINLLTNIDCEFSLSGTARWWRNAFEGWEEYDKCKDKNHFMNDVAIFNMFGFYSPTLSEKPAAKSYIDDEIKAKIIKLLKKCSRIYIMWYVSIDWWFGKDGLLGIDIEECKDRVFVVNSKCSCNAKFKNAESYSEFLKRKKKETICIKR